MDRLPPPEIEPVVLDGVRYEQATARSEDPKELESGYLRAIELNSGKELWLRRVYAPDFDDEEERDGQEVYFITFSPTEDGAALRVENEAGEVWRVDPATGASELLHCPPPKPDFDPSVEN
jgi:hypothetical protein